MSTLSSQLHTIQDYIRYASTAFNQSNLYFGQGFNNAIDEAKHLVLSTLSLPLDIPLEFYAAKLTNDEKLQILEYIDLRISQNIPVAYLTHQAWFCNLPFYVDESVLIPRSPIAELINNKFDGLINFTPNYILDLCTGSGCIGIALAYAYPESEVDLVDISPEALNVSQINIESHGLAHRVLPISSDLFNDVPQRAYDLIVTNPPYVDAEDMLDLPDEFKLEPKLALEAGFDGLDLVKRILKESANYLTDNGVLICEVGNSSVALCDAFPDIDFKWITFKNGGDGVFLLTKSQLVSFQNYISKVIYGR